MTDGLARTLRRYGPPEPVERYLPLLASQDLDALHQGAMFMTEQGAGSDISATVVTAEPRNEGTHALFGAKWFRSNPDAELAHVLARVAGGPPGLKGVGLLLLPRTPPEGSTNVFRTLRLKDKFGTRSMASGEVRLEGARAWLIGDPEAGFRQVIDIVNNSRLSNGVRAAGMMRRAVFRALHVARERRAFGRRLIEMPLMRILTPLPKHCACRDARQVTGDAMKVRSGCGHIEQRPEAKLLREAHLGSIWEGTRKIVALDLLHDARREGAQEALGAFVAARLDAAPLAGAAAWARAKVQR